MKNRKWYEWILTITYIAMLALCVFLNLTNGNKEGLSNIIVNIVMFIIVGLIFLSIDLKSFGPMNRIIIDLTNATAKIKEDAMNTHDFLWAPYQSNKVELFRTRYLQELLRDFIFDLNREKNSDKTYYRPTIDDYINGTLVDKVMHRSELNQVAGVLTGLGILGTFIGLSLGLQNFNTGTTAEMTNSIEPLMNGIKVAFHTSIYGMVFSLVFNSVYRKKLYEAELAVDEFNVAFNKYVLPDTSNDGMNQILAYQQKQLEAINDVSDYITSDLASLINPHLDRLHEQIVDFENMATRNQAESMAKIVEFFIAEMNKSLGATFAQLDNAVADMYKIQSENANLMQEVLKTASVSTGSISDVNKETERLVITLNKYSEGIQAVLDELQNTIKSLEQRDDNNKGLLDEERQFIAAQGNMINEMKKSLEEIVKASQKNGEDTVDALAEINDSMYFIRKSLDNHQASKSNRR